MVYWDDTVVMVDTKRSCFRFYGDDKIAFYVAHEHKNKEELDEGKILSLLPKETIVEHDHNKVNYNAEYVFSNAECNRHLLSDLKKVIDNLNHTWAKQLKELLTSTDHKRNNLIKKGKDEFPQEQLNIFEEKFTKIMAKAYDENEKDKANYNSKDELTLINRIMQYKGNYFLWVYNFDVPFTNNLSERGLRGVKSKQKASGQFQNIITAGYYADIRTYIETCYRNKVNVYNALIKLSMGEPYQLKDILEGNVII